jgi:hypothetical protein
MSRTISHAKAGNFCVRSQTFAWGNSTLQFELLNLNNNREQVNKEINLREDYPYGWAQINFGHVQAGQYQLTIRNLSMKALLIVEGCPGMLHFLIHTYTVTILVKHDFFLSISGESFDRENMTPPPLAKIDHCILTHGFLFGGHLRSIFPHGYTNATFISEILYFFLYVF